MSFLISALFHLALIGGMVLVEVYQEPSLKRQAASPDASKPSPLPPIPVELVDAPKAKPEPKKEKAKISEPGGDIPCPDDKWYGGVGLEHDLTTGQINKVYPGYPAYDSGVRTGDLILNPDELRGPPGSVATIRVERQGIPMVFQTQRKKICTND